MTRHLYRGSKMKTIKMESVKLANMAHLVKKAQ